MSYTVRPNFTLWFQILLLLPQTQGQLFTTTYTTDSTTEMTPEATNPEVIKTTTVTGYK